MQKEHVNKTRIRVLSWGAAPETLVLSPLKPHYHDETPMKRSCLSYRKGMRRSRQTERVIVNRGVKCPSDSAPDL